MTRATRAVIRREYLQRVRSKWFVIGTLAAPVLMTAFIIVPAFFAAQGERSDRRLAVVDETGLLYDALAARLERVGYRAEAVAPADRAALDARLREGELPAYLVLDQATLDRGRAVLHAENAPSTLRRSLLSQVIGQAAVEARLGAETAAEVRGLLDGADLEVRVVEGGGGGMEDPRIVLAYMGSFVLYIVVLLYSASVMRSVLEEKTSRVVEVVISSIRPFELMLGKILGVGAVGLTQLAVWVAMGALFAGIGIPALLTARPELAELSQVVDILPGVGFLALFLVYFLGGYFIFSGLYAAVGAMCSTEEEAQQAQFPVMMLLIVPVVVLVGVVEAPNSTASVVLSLIPFFSPVLMFARAAGGVAPAWQIGLSFVLMALTVAAVAWVAGRIYKVGILMAGKRPTLPELWRWVREA